VDGKYRRTKNHHLNTQNENNANIVDRGDFCGGG
jgi:hypothetical protein